MSTTREPTRSMRQPICVQSLPLSRASLVAHARQRSETKHRLWRIWEEWTTGPSSEILPWRCSNIGGRATFATAADSAAASLNASWFDQGWETTVRQSSSWLTLDEKVHAQVSRQWDNESAPYAQSGSTLAEWVCIACNAPRQLHHLLWSLNLTVT